MNHLAPRRLPYPKRRHLASLAAGYLGAGAGVLGLTLLTLGAGASSSAARGAESVNAVAYGLIAVMAYLGACGWAALERALGGLRWAGVTGTLGLGIWLSIAIATDVAGLATGGSLPLAAASALFAALLVARRARFGVAALASAGGLATGAALCGLTATGAADLTALMELCWVAGYAGLALTWLGEQERYESPAPRW